MKNYTKLILCVVIEIISYFYFHTQDLELFFFLWAAIALALIGFRFFEVDNPRKKEARLFWMNHSLKGPMFRPEVMLDKEPVKTNKKKETKEQRNKTYVLLGIYFLLNLSGLLIYTFLHY
jgi:hypothetical protein